MEHTNFGPFLALVAIARLELFGFGCLAYPVLQGSHLLWPLTRNDYPALVAASHMKAIQSTRHCLVEAHGWRRQLIFTTVICPMIISANQWLHADWTT